MQEKKKFRKNYYSYFLKSGLIISCTIHLLMVGSLFGMNALFFDKHEEKESYEFEMLEPQSIEINALSAEEVRALIAALERKEAGSGVGETQSDGDGGESAGVEEQVPLSKKDQNDETAAILPPET